MNEEKKTVLVDDQFRKVNAAVDRTTNLAMKFHPLITEFKDDKDIDDILRPCFGDIIKLGRLRSYVRRYDFERLLKDNGIDPKELD